MSHISRQCRGSNALKGLLGGTTLALSMLVGPVHAQQAAQHIIAYVGFPCGFNEFAGSLCAGFESGAQQLPEGFTFEIKTGIDYADQTALNNLIETSLALNPAGMIVFPGGPAAQRPILERACEQGIKLIIIDNPVEGIQECQSAFIATDHRELGEKLGQWLIDNPPRSKQIGIVSLPPGQYASVDARIAGFTETVKPAGYEIVATIATDLSLDKTRTLVTNMVSAHPELGTVMSWSDPTGDGVSQAIDDPEITQISIDGYVNSVKRILTGELDADAAQDPFHVAELAVLTMVKVLQGEAVPAETYTPTMVIDAHNAEAYIAGGGMQGLVADK